VTGAVANAKTALSGATAAGLGPPATPPPAVANTVAEFGKTKGDAHAREAKPRIPGLVLAALGGSAAVAAVVGIVLVVARAKPATNAGPPATAAVVADPVGAAAPRTAPGTASGAAVATPPSAAAIERHDTTEARALPGETAPLTATAGTGATGPGGPDTATAGNAGGNGAPAAAGTTATGAAAAHATASGRPAPTPPVTTSHAGGGHPAAGGGAATTTTTTKPAPVGTTGFGGRE
jgi:hypothetical protein